MKTRNGLELCQASFVCVNLFTTGCQCWSQKQQGIKENLLIIRFLQTKMFSILIYDFVQRGFAPVWCCCRPPPVCCTPFSSFVCTAGFLRPQHPLLIIHPQPIVTELLLGGRHTWRCAPEPFKLHIIHQKISGLHQFVDLLQELLFLLSVLFGLVIICITRQRRT